jgi:hypothetical protein
MSEKGFEDFRELKDALNDDKSNSTPLKGSSDDTTELSIEKQFKILLQKGYKAMLY